MFYYEERTRTWTNDYGPQSERTINIYDRSDLVGQLTISTVANRWDRANSPVTICYYDLDDKRMSYLGAAKTVSEGKAKFSKWYEEHGDKIYHAPVKELTDGDNAEFFPTPGKLAGRMAALVNWNDVHTILEPSAGKGDLADAVLKGCVGRSHDRYREVYREKEKVDVIELDANLRRILEGKGYRVVFDDFLSFETKKTYDLVIMNPPFSNGDEHLLKAIELQKSAGGQIVCLLNAETVRNPYTIRRQILKNSLAEYAAHIEFVKDAFKRADRRSDVEVAIVYLAIPKPVRRSNIIEGLKKAQEIRRQKNVNPEALTTGDWGQQMVDNFNFEAEAGIKLMEEYAAIAPYIMNGSDDYSKPLIQLYIAGKDKSRIDAGVVNDYLRKLRNKYWRALFSRRELTSKMTSDMQNDFYNRVDEMEEYDFNIYNVRRMILEITAQLNQGVVDSIMKLFEKFTDEHSYYPECQKTIHYYTGWKTNKAHKIGKKVIIPINGYAGYSWKKDELDAYRICGVINDLERALTYLNNGDVSFFADSSREVKRANVNGVNKCYFTYFDCVFYKKGTCHITFHDDAMRIVDRLNIFAGQRKAWLPPNYGKKSYAEMTQEEKDVIDSFQGEAEYAKVYADPGNYLFSPENSIKLIGA